MNHKTHTNSIHMQEPFFTQVVSGIKKVEGRLNKSKFFEMKIGDEILLNEEVTLEITNKTVYKSFREMITCEGINNVIPDATSLNEAEEVYRKFYSVQDEELYGVAAIEVRVI